MKALNVLSMLNEGSYTYSIMGYDDKPSFLHIDNYRTRCNSVLIPLEMVHKIANLVEELES